MAEDKFDYEKAIKLLENWQEQHKKEVNDCYDWKPTPYNLLGDVEEMMLADEYDATSMAHISAARAYCFDTLESDYNPKKCKFAGELVKELKARFKEDLEGLQAKAEEGDKDGS